MDSRRASTSVGSVAVRTFTYWSIACAAGGSKQQLDLSCANQIVTMWIIVLPNRCAPQPPPFSQKVSPSAAHSRTKQSLHILRLLINVEQCVSTQSVSEGIVQLPQVIKNLLIMSHHLVSDDGQDNCTSSSS
jgi:hypothetical protein